MAFKRSTVRSRSAPLNLFNNLPSSIVTDSLFNALGRNTKEKRLKIYMMELSMTIAVASGALFFMLLL